MSFPSGTKFYLVVLYAKERDKASKAAVGLGLLARQRPVSRRYPSRLALHPFIVVMKEGDEWREGRCPTVSY